MLITREATIASLQTLWSASNLFPYIRLQDHHAKNLVFVNLPCDFKIKTHCHLLLWMINEMGTV